MADNFVLRGFAVGDMVRHYVWTDTIYVITDMSVKDPYSGVANCLKLEPVFQISNDRSKISPTQEYVQKPRFVVPRIMRNEYQHVPAS